MARRMVKRLADRAIPHSQNPLHVVTISGGIGEIGSGINGKSHWKGVVAEADLGLYKAKRNGRNQIGIDPMERDLRVAEQNN